MASFCLMLILFVCISSGFGQDPSCKTVKSAWRSKRLTESEVPPSAVDGNDLRVCPKDSGKQCCSRRMEDRFAGLARGDFDEAVSEKVGEIKTLFNEQAKTFDDYVRGLIKKSQHDLDTMFTKIYGSYYQQHNKMFMDLYLDMANYFNFDTSLDVNNIMDKFFSKLMSGMFQIMNARYRFTDSYLNCVSKYMENLQPFGDVPQKLKPQVHKVLLHARTFSKALHEGRDAIHMLEKAISSSQECENDLVKLKYCSWCKAMTSLKPCLKFCTDVHKGCLADIAKVNTQWQNYMAALNNILEKQTGATNIQDVMTPINVKISTAIMNFQNSTKMKEVKEKVFQAKECGSPGISKRSTDDFFLEGSNRQRRDSGLTLARSDSSKVSFDKLTTSFKVKMKGADKFWSTLPEKVCSEVSAKDNSDCWNGVGKGSYTSPNDGGNNVAETPKPSVQQAIDKLSKVVVQLDAAINGEEVIDNEVSGSASGSAMSGDEESSGESGDENEITEDTASPRSDSENEIDGENEQENDVMGGGVGKPTPGLRRNSASPQHTRAWLLVSTLWLFLAIFIA